MLDLTQADQVCEEENRDLVRWARIFKAASMRELEQLSEKEDTLEEMVTMVKQLSEDEKIRLRLAAQERYERDMLMDRKIAREEGVLQGQAQAVAALMQQLQISREKAMDLLQIPAERREKLMKYGV